MTGITALGRRLCCGAVQAYQWLVSPLFPGCCRFHPTCSSYAIEAITQHGALRGLWLSTKRLLRCNPWGGAGLDPVPESQRRPGQSDRHHA